MADITDDDFSDPRIRLAKEPLAQRQQLLGAMASLS